MAWINICDIVYPVGTTYETTSSTSPAELLGGTWSLKSSSKKRIQIGSQCIYWGTSGTSTCGWTNDITAYDYELIDGVFDNITVPAGYHRAYRLTFQGTTYNNTYLYLALNNISTNSVLTWSGNTFRVVGSTDFFKETDIVLETANGYSSKGINLKHRVTGTSSSWQFWDATIHGFFESDDTFYEWVRTA